LNYLVHLYLSGPEPEHQLGGLMGDFVKGPVFDFFPEKIRQGLQLHRRIDSLAHKSRYTRQSRQRLQEKYGHGKGIIVDIFYDHFLAANWNDFSDTALEQYAESIYTLLKQNHAALPEGLQQITPRMSKYNWLVSYQHHEVVGKALQRIAQRLSRPLPLHEATDDLEQHKKLFLADFYKFMDEATGFVKQEMGN
jgi:acyl carrier protein phosphodiesterase